MHRRRRVAEDRVKIDDRIEFAARANPIINSLPQLLAVRARRCERIVDGAVKRCQRPAIDVEALGVRPRNELPIARDQLIGQLTSQLSLKPDQQKQLTSIVDDTRAQWRNLYAPLEPQHEQIRQQGRERIRAILTPEQRTKFEEFMQRLDEQRKRDQAQ